MTFGEVLKQLRMEKGLSQQQLADRLYVDRSSVTRWESGSRLPDAFMITKISECLGTEASILLNMTASVAEKANVILVDDEKIILSGSLPIIEGGCLRVFQTVGSHFLRKEKPDRPRIPRYRNRFDQRTGSVPEAA